MAAYVVQRLGTVMFIMVAMSVLVFLATHALPSNAAALILGQYSTPETQAALEHKLGFDQPLPVQYWHWASRYAARRHGAIVRDGAAGGADPVGRLQPLGHPGRLVDGRGLHPGLGARRDRGGVARPMAGPCRVDLHLFRRLAAGVLLGSRLHPVVLQHVPSAAFLRVCQPLRWARALLSPISCCRSRP